MKIGSEPWHSVSVPRTGDVGWKSIAQSTSQWLVGSCWGERSWNYNDHDTVEMSVAKMWIANWPAQCAYLHAPHHTRSYLLNALDRSMEGFPEIVLATDYTVDL